jgi:dipeptidyl aminopeptidase/acylaminoacyl peptidase
MFTKSLYAMVVLWSFLALPNADARVPFKAQDLVNLDRVSSPVGIPGRSAIVFVRRVTDLPANRGRTDLWMVNTNGKGLRQLTTDSANEYEPCPAPDGQHIYFLSTSTGTTQVWKVPTESGPPVAVTSLPLDINAFKLSPDGTQLIMSVDVFPGQSIEETAKRLEDVATSQQTGRVYDRLFVRHWDTWKDGRRSHLFVMPVSGGTPVDVMRTMDADVPAKPFGGVHDFTFSPDGSEVVFAARLGGKTEAWSTNFDLYKAPADGSKAPVRITTNLAWDTEPTFSPDGSTLAYLAMSRAGYESDRFRIVLRSWPDGENRVLTEEWDHSARSLAWSNDGKTIYTTAAHRGQVPLYGIDVATGNPTTLVEQGTVSDLAMIRDRVVYRHDHLKSPAEIYTLRRDGRTKQITKLNESRLARIAFGEPEQFSFDGWDGDRVFGYVVKPAQFRPNKKYPIAFLIHGGPQGSFGNHWHYRWNPQTYAGRGYASVFIDFHGSTGYGQAFTDSIQGDWGGKPLEDLQKGLATALRRYEWLDGERVAALGASYGGYMVNWIAGQWPDRFKCLVNHDGVFDTRMMYFDTEELWFPEWENKGTPWTNPSGFSKYNPADHVGRWKTPMLVIHGALDFRVTETQGIGAFTALQRRGIPSKFLYFPDENHWVLKPHNSIQWHDTVMAWLDQWTK